MLLLIMSWDMWGSDYGSLTAPQMMVRAVVTFVLALLIIRMAGLRSFGSKSAFDVVLSITVGAVLSHCITGKYSYLACAGAATVLALMHRLVAFLVMNHAVIARWIKGEPHVLVKKSRIVWRNMRRHHITREDLLQSMHKRGYSGLAEIDEAIFETDGKITLIPNRKAETA